MVGPLDERTGKPGELIIVTGSSHAGKSTLIGELRSRCERETSVVSIDETIEQLEIEEEGDDRWEHGLHLAYEKAAAEVWNQVSRGKIVFFESTFTYVPPDKRPSEFHLHELERLVDLALNLGVNVTLIHLFAGLDDVTRRRDESGRLTENIVRTTWRHHAEREFARPDVLRVDTSELSSTEAADYAWRELSARGRLG